MADIPPLIQVSHLPSASSFYASLTQPLGLQFLAAAPISPTTLHFGFVSNSPSGLRKTTVFTLSESPAPRLSHITLLAPTSKAILEFHQKSTVLNPDYRLENTLVKTEDDERAITRDPDGNMIETVYVPRGSRGGGAHRERGVTIETASSEKEAKRVLEWQENVARSISEEPDDEPRGSPRGSPRNRVEYSQSAPRPGTFHRSDTFPRTRPRRDTITNDTYRREHQIQETERSPLGITGNAMLGTIIAAGAAFALFQTVTHARATAPDPLSPSSSTSPPRRRTSETHYTHSPIRMEDRETVVERIPARSYVSQREREERTTPRYVQYNVVTKPSAPPMTRELARIDNKSHVSTSASHRSHRTQRERSRSDVGVRPHYEHRPLTINPAPLERETQSHVSTSRRHRSESHRERSDGSSGSSGRERERRRERDRERDRARDREMEREMERERERERERDRSRERSHTDSYATARTHHSISTIKPSKQPLPEVPNPPPAASYVSTGTVRAARNPQPARPHMMERERERARDMDRERERERERERDSPRRNEWDRDRIERARMVPLPESVVSARQIPLPRSMAGGIEYEYEESVAPSDSVSSVGVKRERERLKERMRDRGLQGRWDA